MPKNLSSDNERGMALPSRLPELSRRHLLKIGGLGLLGLNTPQFLQAAEQKSAPIARAKSVIFLYQFGGPSHVDMFDMKPDAPDGIRSPLGSISSSVPGLPVCEHLPEVAKVMDRVTLVRSMYHNMKNHNSAAYYALTGRAPPLDDIRLRDSLELFPAYGSIVDRLATGAEGMPKFVAHPYTIRDGAITPGQHASFLGKVHDPLLVTEDPNSPSFRLPELSLPANLSLARLESRRHLQQMIDKQSRLLDASAGARGLDSYYEKALSMLNSPRVGRAFDLSAEPDKVRDRYGRTTYGQSCLLARRLVESGVKFVNVYFSDSIGGKSTTSGGWDTHGFDNTRMFPIVQKYHLPITNQTLPVLLLDLEERGLLDTTLVVWMGEFGRTPKINDNISRDHWPFCYTALLAGGGVKRGHIHGASDKQGMYPARDPVRPDDLAATMFSLLGLNPDTEINDAANRPLVIASGNPITQIMS
jgi:hypothetical protein